MTDLAACTGNRIGVAATLNTTLVPTTELIQSCAEARSKQLEILPRLCEGAFDAVIAGDTSLHDKLVKNGYIGLEYRPSSDTIGSLSWLPIMDRA